MVVSTASKHWSRKKTQDLSMYLPYPHFFYCKFWLDQSVKYCYVQSQCVNSEAFKKSYGVNARHQNLHKEVSFEEMYHKCGEEKGRIRSHYLYPHTGDNGSHDGDKEE